MTVAATIALAAASLAFVSLTLSLFACEARAAAADDKTNRQAPFIQSGVMTRDKQPIATDVSRRWRRTRRQGGGSVGGTEGGRAGVGEGAASAPSSPSSHLIFI